MNEDLIKQQFNLLNKGVLITIFSYKDSNQKDLFRVYFKDLNNGYLYNPLNKENDKIIIPVYNTAIEALKEVIKQAYKYLENGRNIN